MILGASGFIGQELIKELRGYGVECIGFNSSSLDLTTPESAETLSRSLRPSDTVVFLSALTPDKGKGIDTFDKNIRMAMNVYRALEKTPANHLVYFSSDAVYSMDENIISEDTLPNPADLYGLMHFTRERLFKATFDNLLIFRPTLVYGFHDTHNSYGPNRLRRMAQESGEMTLFGGGEETRDHILVQDLVKLLVKALLHKTIGDLNAVTGHSLSYMKLAQMINNIYGGHLKIKTTERQNAVTHRHFDNSHIFKLFPDFIFTPIDEGLSFVHSQELNVA